MNGRCTSAAVALFATACSYVASPSQPRPPLPFAANATFLAPLPDVTEETREGWEASTGTTAEVTVSGDPNDEENVVSGIDFGNYRLGALSIGKENDADDGKLAGEKVRYTLTVTASEGRVKGVKVNDLPPEVTTYTPGSWSASSSLGGALVGNLKLVHVYASPGIYTPPD
jgi:uncharacterized repeat protein (TIGR01451 family)